MLETTISFVVASANFWASKYCNMNASFLSGLRRRGNAACLQYSRGRAKNGRQETKKMDEHKTNEAAVDPAVKYAAVKRSEEAAMEAALAAEVTITLEKKAGSETFHRNIRASSASAAVNALAVLIRETAAILDMREAEVLAVLATVMAGPTFSAEQEG